MVCIIIKKVINNAKYTPDKTSEFYTFEIFYLFSEQLPKQAFNF